MFVKSIRTHKVQPHESLFALLDQYLTHPQNESILVITSKIISLCQGRVVPKDQCTKQELIVQEADATLQDGDDNRYNVTLTLKNNILIPSAGIDESNDNGHYILYPEHLQDTTNRIWLHLKGQHNLTKLGIIITDSHTTPLRRGVTGIGLSWCGFEPLYSYVGKLDIDNKPLQFTHINIVDALATSAVLMMGEGEEQTPLALIANAPKIQFCDTPPTPEQIRAVSIPMEEDLYAPLLKKALWTFA